MARLSARCLLVIFLFAAAPIVWSGDLFAQSQNAAEQTIDATTDPGPSTRESPVPPEKKRITGHSITDSDTGVSTYDLEIERQFNRLRSELLDQRANSIDLWLAALALIFTFFGIVVAIGGFFGYSRFRQIEAEAKTNAKVAEDFATQAKNSTEEIIKNREKSEDIIKTLTANVAVDNPENVSELIDSVRSNPDSTLLANAVADAFSLYSQGKIVESLRKWHAIAELAEDHDRELAARAWLSVGFLVATRDLEYSIMANGRAIELNPSLAEAYVNRGAAKHALGRYEEAVADYDEAIRQNPDFANGYSNRGVSLSATGKYREAIVDHDKAIRLRPDQASFYANRGTVHDELGEHEAAIEDHDKAIRLQSNKAEYYSNRGVAKAGAGRYEEAMADHNEAIRLEPNRAAFYNNRGNANLAAGQRDAAVVDFTKAIEVQPEFAKAYNNRGNAYLAMSRHSDAIREYDEALRLKEDYAEAYNNRGEARAALTQYDAAKDDYDKALAINPRLARIIREQKKQKPWSVREWCSATTTYSHSGLLHAIPYHQTECSVRESLEESADRQVRPGPRQFRRRSGLAQGV